MHTLLFTFANSFERRLETLQREDEQLFAALSQREAAGHFRIVRDPYCSSEKIAEYIRLYRDQLALFHYSGHAGEHGLETEGGDAHAVGLAHMLGQCPNLHVVVLNGCSTGGQVDGLLKAGVRAVIATSAPISDPKATEFSISLYKSLALGSSLQEAFDAGLGAAQLQAGAIEAHRGVAKSFGGSDPKQPLWGMYIASELDAQWKLPNLPDFTAQSYTPNEKLIQSLLTGFSPYNEEVKQLADKIDNGDEVNVLDMREAILKCPPHPISEQLRKLLVPGDANVDVRYYDKPGPDRLRQIAATYTTSIELLAYVMLSQLWEVLLNNPLPLPAPLDEQLRAYFRLTPQEREHYNFIPLIRGVRQFFDDNQVAYFVEELNTLRQNLGESTAFAKSIEFLEALKNRIRQTRGEIAANEALTLCMLAEDHLAEFLKGLGFIARYTLASVKDIDVIKFRHLRTAKYKHRLVKLVQRFVGLSETTETFEAFMDNSSVLLMRNGAQPVFLNLSPFIIDESAYDDKASIAKLHFFERYDKGADALAYRHIYKPDDMPLVVRDQKNFKPVKDLFNAFSDLLFHQPLNTL